MKLSRWGDVLWIISSLTDKAPFWLVHFILEISWKNVHRMGFVLLENESFEELSYLDVWILLQDLKT